MAEKEERIWLEYDIPKPKGAIEATRYTTMTRKEAINRIAKALYLFNREDEWYKEHADMYSKYMNNIAEAALDALLSSGDTK